MKRCKHSNLKMVDLCCLKEVVYFGLGLAKKKPKLKKHSSNGGETKSSS